jgi:hypothetical protein
MNLYLIVQHWYSQSVWMLVSLAYRLYFFIQGVFLTEKGLGAGRSKRGSF